MSASASLPTLRDRRLRRFALACGLLLVAAAGLALSLRQPGAPLREETGDAYVARLEAHLRSQPRDGRGWVLLARAHAESDRFADAANAFERAIAVAPKVRRDPAVLCEFADALGMAQRSLGGRPLELIQQALAIDPAHPVALEMAGSAAYEQRRYAEAARHWKLLLAQLVPASERHVELAAAIERAERRAAVALPPASG